jgi:hypothetical protein
MILVVFEVRIAATSRGPASRFSSCAFPVIDQGVRGEADKNEVSQETALLAEAGRRANRRRWGLDFG